MKRMRKMTPIFYLTDKNTIKNCWLLGVFN